METEKIRVRLVGVADIMFDRFIDHSKEKRPPEQKLYLIEDNIVTIPTENIYAFLFGENPQGCAAVFEGKKKKDYLRVGQSHVFIDPLALPIEKNDKKLKFTGFDPENWWIHRGAPRTKQGSLSIKQEVKERPVLKLPWSVKFTVSIVKNALINETKLYNWFTAGGIQIGLGTYRPRFGRFQVEEWQKV